MSIANKLFTAVRASFLLCAIAVQVEAGRIFFSVNKLSMLALRAIVVWGKRIAI